MNRRKSRLIAALLALAWAGCNKPASTVERKEEAPEIAAAPLPAAPPAVVKAAAAPATPAPAVVELAPPGKWFLRRKASIETADGIVGLPPGTAVELISPNQYRLAAGGTVTLAASEVTNVISEVRAIVSADRAGQAAATRIAPAPAPVNLPAAAARQPAAPARPTTGAPAVARTERGQEYVPGVNAQPSGLQSSTALGAAHSRVSDGWVWQKNPEGTLWIPIKQLDSRKPEPLPRRN